MPYKEAYKVTTCNRCGKEFSITSKNYYKKIRSNSEFRCPACRALENGERKVYRASHRSEQSKLSIRRKKQQSWANQSEDVKRLISERRRQYMSRDDIRKFYSDKARNQWLSKTPDEIIQWRQKISEGWKLWNDNLSESDKALMSYNNRIAWNNKSDEYKEFHIKRMQSGWRNWWNSLDNESKIYYQSLLKAGNHKWWESMTPEERHAFAKNNWDNLSQSWKDEIAKKISDSFINKTYEEKILWNIRFMESTSKSGKNKDSPNEIDFMNLLNIYDLKYSRMQFNNTAHDKFHELFPMNTVTGGTFVSPFHMWDFLIHCRNNQVFIDIDGSIHDPSKTNYDVRYQNGCIIKLSEYMQFNDSQRLYQTDGLDAYIVKCYDDKITYDTLVVKVSSGETMNIHSLLTLLSEFY